MRPEPKFSPPEIPETLPQQAGILSEVRLYQLITPLFGGGVTPAEADPVTIIRPTEIRGHLRFWWRATRAGRFGDEPQSLREMKQAEAKLWGAASTKDNPCSSQVQIAVKVISPGREVKPFEIYTASNGKLRSRPRPSAKVPPYAAFPMQPTEEELRRQSAREKSLWEGISFELTIRYPDTEDARVDILAALWAWETFGGLGARTRRGFGALVRADTPLVADTQVQQRILEGLRQYVSPGTWPEGVPHLSREPRHLRLVKGLGNVNEAWAKLIDDLKDFRQYREAGSNPKQPGRSLWPEPDAIRRRAGHAPYHKPRTSVDKFPRAAFGLPIIFHFKRDDAQKGDPPDTTLQMKSHDRLGSPLLLRPLACANGRAVALASVLQWSPRLPEKLILKGAPGDPTVEWELTQAEARSLGDTVSDETDVLKAFLDYLEE